LNNEKHSSGVQDKAYLDCSNQMCWQSLVTNEELCIFLRENVVRDTSQWQFLREGLSQLEDERRFATAYWTSNAYRISSFVPVVPMVMNVMKGSRSAIIVVASYPSLAIGHVLPTRRTASSQQNGRGHHGWFLLSEE
jgi:hypothetical protein